MLFAYGRLDSAERRALERTSAMRHDLRHYVVQEPRRWTGLLARMTRARALRASNSIEGINVSHEDAIAVIDNEDPAEADKPTFQAVQGYRAAMDYMLQRRRDETFRFSLDTILSVHFMISQHHLKANPGNMRPGWVCVRNSTTGEIVHEGVDRDFLMPLMNELIDYMNSDEVDGIELKGAMTHLNLVLLHPFSDGNGRTARCLQSAILAKEGIIPAVFSSIEEYIGHNQQEYYDVLAQTGGGGWHPQRDCKAWVRFCITGHYRQAQTLLRRVRLLERTYGDFVAELEKRGLPERMALAMYEASTGLRVRNASYRISADISNNLASRDLKALVDEGLLLARGERRGRHYVAGRLITEIRNRHKPPRKFDDPFAENDH
jgi:Fic family protein